MIAEELPGRDSAICEGRFSERELGGLGGLVGVPMEKESLARSFEVGWERLVAIVELEGDASMDERILGAESDVMTH